MSVPLTPEVLAIDAAAEAARIASGLRDAVVNLRRRGVVLGISGGVDSSVCLALAVRAFGAERVCALMMPETDSSEQSAVRAAEVAAQFGVTPILENIAPALDALGCYARRDRAIRDVVPDYTEGWRSKIAIAGGRDGTFNYFKLVVQSPDGTQTEHRLPHRTYLEIVAATNFKQRVRKIVEYHHADRLNYAVLGTPNRLEYDQGFFVKVGDGAADVKPIAHLYKRQVYALAACLDLPEAVRNAAPTTDTYSLAQGQDEFYFALPWQAMDLALWAANHQRPAAELAACLGLSHDRAEFVFRDIESKRRATAYLHAAARLMEPVPLAFG
ncbi:MAG: NAD(+) synthase [Betaproteobacteria bacterium]|nr:NAD(+) synthase [Betaproteobacteria bacterium]